MRDLNDEINKLIREKRHWERQIKALGGPAYKSAPVVSEEGSAVPGSARYLRGYMYFGAAKKLPGVAELFAKKAVKPKKRTRSQMYKGTDAEYYGYGHEADEASLVAAEQRAEDEKMAKLDDGWHARRQARRARIERERDERAAAKLAARPATEGAALAAASAARAGLAPVAAAASSAGAAPRAAATTAGRVAHSFDDPAAPAATREESSESDGGGDDLSDLVGLTAGVAGTKSLVSVPTQRAMGAELLARKKAMLMRMFVDVEDAEGEAAEE